MEAKEIVTIAKTSSEPPAGWIVLPLSRQRMMPGIVGWTFGIIMGLGLFAMAAEIVIPVNYEQGLAATIFTTFLLSVLLFIGLGSVWSLVHDIRRYLLSEQHIIVITPDEFVKQEGKKIISVPLANVSQVTARGTPPPDRTPGKQSEVRQIPGLRERVTGLFAGPVAVGEGARRRRRRLPTSLAFVDTRTNDEVIVATDGAYGDPFMIAALLKQHASAA